MARVGKKREQRDEEVYGCIDNTWIGDALQRIGLNINKLGLVVTLS